MGEGKGERNTFFLSLKGWSFARDKMNTKEHNMKNKVGNIQNNVQKTLYYSQESLPISAFLSKWTTDLWTRESIIPATVKTPPIIAQTCTRKCKKDSRVYEN